MGTLYIYCFLCRIRKAQSQLEYTLNQVAFVAFLFLVQWNWDSQGEETTTHHPDQLDSVLGIVGASLQWLSTMCAQEGRSLAALSFSQGVQ